MNRILTRREQGVTLTELLVVLLIIGLLASAAVPAFVTRQEEARRKVAMGESREIAQAEEMVAVTHGFYVPFQVLDDMPPRSGSSTNEERIDLLPYNIFAINPMISSANQLLGQTQFQGLSTTPFNQRVVNMVKNWTGPYANFQRFYIPSPQVFGTNAYYSSGAQYQDYPLDPWGNPYRFYSASGLIGTGATDRSFNFSTNFSDGRLTTNDRRFDRYAVVSWGNDGLSDTSGGGVIDDIIYLFGADGVESNFGRIF